MTSSNYTGSNDVATFVLETDAPYNILDFDQGLCAMTGYSPRELSNKICTLDNLLYVDDFAEVIASINYQLSISNLVSIQNRIVTKNGNILTVLCNGQAFSLNDGRDVLQCVFTDITNLENAASETAQAKTDLEMFANTVPSGVSKHLLDNNLTLIWANNFFYDMCGLSPADFNELYGKNTLSIVYSEDLSIVIDTLADLTEDLNSKIVNFRIRGGNESIRWVNAIFARSGEMSEGFPVVNLVMSDITDLKIAEMKATLEEQKYLIISDISEELPYEYDIPEDIITFAEKFNNIFDDEAIIQNPAKAMAETGLVSHDTKDALEELFTLAKRGTEYHTAEFKLNTKTNGYQWYFSVFSTIFDEDKKPVRAVGLLRNIHTQKMEQQKLVQKAETDLMTGLLNKATTESRIKSHLRNLDGNIYNVLMLVDIDDFKKINDTYGHLKGDEVITDIAGILKEYTGEYDLAGRLGGDEFCVYFSDLLDVQVACEKAAMIAHKLKAIYAEKEAFTVTLSIGIAATNEQITYNTLLENADTALYQAKLNGKDCYYCYHDDMERVSYENARTEIKPAGSEKIINELLSMLFDNSNTHLAIEKSLNIIGNTYDIDKICIWEKSGNDNFVDCTHQWCASGIKNDIHTRQHTPIAVFEELDSLGTDGIIYSPDTSLIKLSTSNMNPYSEGIKRMIQARILLSGKTIGYMGLYTIKNETPWSLAALADFKLIFKILSEAVCSKRSEHNLSLFREDTINVFDIIDNPLIVINQDTYDIMYFNETAKEYYSGLHLNSKCYSCMYQESSPCSDCCLHKLSKDSSVKCTKRNKSTDELLDINMSKINWSPGSNTFLIIVNAHKQTEAERLKKELEQNITIEKKIAEASYRDIVTGFGNFEKFKLTCQDILDSNPDVDYVMLYYNIKNFKFINETYGHNVGDQTLKAVAEVMHKHLDEDEAFSRIISDTFIMLIHHGNNEHFMHTFNSICDEVHDTCRNIQDKFNVDFTTGILVIDESLHSYSVNRLIDRAMMTGKSIDASTGLCYAFYNDEIHKTIMNDAQMENNMQSAMENKEFCAYVQPKYDIATKKLMGGELLIRWISPSKGFLEPASFIPSFEKNGFIYQIDCFMLEEACKSLRKYLDSDIHVLPFSVNLSRTTIAHSDFLSRVHEIVDKYCIPHHYIEFEITESTLSKNYDQMIGILTNLRNEDFSINMDDFGTGYSSLTLLKDLPVDVLKLDHDFLTRSIANDKNAIHILKGIIDMAHALDIKVVSEGIEDDKQLKILEDIGCEIGQGFLFAKPMPITDYDKLLSDYSENLQ